MILRGCVDKLDNGLRMAIRSARIMYFKDTRYHFSRKPSYWHNPGTEPLKQLTVGQILDNATERWKDKQFLVSEHQESKLTFSETKDKVDLLAQGLLDIGLTTGDHLGIWGVNSKEWALILLSAAKIGIITVNMNPAYEPPEVMFCIKKANLKALAFDLTYRNKNHYDVICNLIPEIDQCNPCSPFSSKEFPDLTHLICFTDTPLKGAFRLKDVFATGYGRKEERLVSEKTIQPENAWNIQFTSGTTGNPKAAMMSHFSNINNAYFFGKRMGLHLKDHKILCQVPFFHVFGTVAGILCSLIHGATLILPGSSFNAQQSLEALLKHKCTVLYGTPTMYIDLCIAVENCPSSQQSLKNSNVDVALTAGALCSPSLFTKLQRTFKCKVISLYGMTEAGPCTFQSKLEDNETQITTTVGSVAESVEVKVVDKDGGMVPMGQPGEIWFRTYGSMLKYWDDDQKTKDALTETRWLKSGDQFVLLEDGYGQVVGRIKDLIIRGGENIAPKEIEHHLEKHPAVREAYVYAVSDERLGEEVACSIRLKGDSTLEEQDIKSFCKDKIAYYKIPKYIEFVQHFPKTTSGKIQKFKLRKMMEEKLEMNKKS